jgi:hypothetical protein
VIFQDLTPNAHVFQSGKVKLFNPGFFDEPLEQVFNHGNMGE